MRYISSCACRRAPDGVATLKVRKDAVDALNKGSGVLGEVKRVVAPSKAPPEELYEKLIENQLTFILSSLFPCGATPSRTVPLQVAFLKFFFFKSSSAPPPHQKKGVLGKNIAWGGVEWTGENKDTQRKGGPMALGLAELSAMMSPWILTMT